MSHPLPGILPQNVLDEAPLAEASGLRGTPFVGIGEARQIPVSATALL